MTLDLHGYTEEEAVGQILSALLSFDLDGMDDQLEIITGKGTGVMMTTTLRILDEERREYDVLQGSVIVYKRKQFDDFNFRKILEEINEK